jgi:SAM-dependent methyltransferase
VIVSDLSSYARHARVWGYYSIDRSEEAAAWVTLARRYGASVLALMCATGEMAADLAQRGLRICAVDFIPEMVREGQRRWGAVENLEFVEGDIRNLELKQKDFDFAFTTDFNHLLTLADCRLALASIYNHLRLGGGLALELSLPSAESWDSPWRTFEPTRSDPTLPPVKTWKRGRTSYAAARRVVTIEQEVFIQEPGQETPESFFHCFELQLWQREEIETLLRETGFRICTQYSDYSLRAWSPESDRWLVEAQRI